MATGKASGCAATQRRGSQLCNLSRRGFLGGLGAVGALGLAGCSCPLCRGGDRDGKIALQLYSINKYIGGVKDKDGKTVTSGVGLERALAEVAKIGYKAVEFAGYYGFSGKQIKKMLDDNGLVACGSHVGGWRKIEGDKLKQVAEFNLEFGNTVLICPGGTGPEGVNWSNPEWNTKCADHMKFITDFYNHAADTAATFGSRVGIHNHQWEFMLKDENGVTFWDHFFSNTTEAVLMEQDVGWTTCAGHDPCHEFVKYPHRSPTLHAKENGMGKDVKEFDGILGRPGRPGAKPVDWDRLIPVAEKNGTEWWVVECERHFEDLSAVTPSYAFLKSKGLN